MVNWYWLILMNLFHTYPYRINVHIDGIDGNDDTVIHHLPSHDVIDINGDIWIYNQEINHQELDMAITLLYPLNISLFPLVYVKWLWDMDIDKRNHGISWYGYPGSIYILVAIWYSHPSEIYIQYHNIMRISWDITVIYHPEIVIRLSG